MIRNRRRSIGLSLLCTPERRRLVGAFLAAALLILAGSLQSKGAELRPETLNAWEGYLQSQSVRIGNYSSATPFLWSDDSPDRLRRLERGEIVVAPVGDNPRRVPQGLIHHWIGAVFLPGAHLRDVLSVARDYGRYKDMYAPNVVESVLVRRSEEEDTFALRMLNNAIVAKFAVDTEFRETFKQIDDNKWYSVSYTTCVREVENYGTPDEHEGVADKGRGLVWRVYSISRFEQRNGGVYMELEAIALSRDIPGALRWVINPIVCRTARSALQVSLSRMERAVLEESRIAKENQHDMPTNTASSKTASLTRVRSGLLP